MCTNQLPNGSELVAPFAFMSMPVSAQPRPYFGMERAQFETYRPANSFPGQGFGLGMAVVEDPRKANLPDSAKGTCWWCGLGSTFFAVNLAPGIGVLFFAQRFASVTRQHLLGEVLRVAHEVFVEQKSSIT